MTPVSQPRPLDPNDAGPLCISRFALVLGALATGRTRIMGVVEVDEVLALVHALRALGVPIAKRGDVWEVLGRGAGGLAQPNGPIYLGSPETAVYPLLGAIAGQPIEVTLRAVTSPGQQPLSDVLKPLGQMGLQVLDGNRNHLPLTVRGSAALVPIACELISENGSLAPAILLAGLAAPGETTVVCEAMPDYAEALLNMFGAEVRFGLRGARRTITVTGEAELRGINVAVPAAAT